MNEIKTVGRKKQILSVSTLMCLVKEHHATEHRLEVQ
jgi:hypothetical protein